MPHQARSYLPNWATRCVKAALTNGFPERVDGFVPLFGEPDLYGVHFKCHQVHVERSGCWPGCDGGATKGSSDSSSIDVARWHAITPSR